MNLLFYLKEKDVLLKKNRTRQPCPSCNRRGTTFLSVERRHIHLIILPIVAVGKHGESYCEHCGLTMPPARMPEYLKKEYLQLERSTSGPLWQNTGILIIAAIILWNISSSLLDKDEHKNYLTEPKTGDVYKYRHGPMKYTTFRVVGHTPDSLFVLNNDYEVLTREDFEKIIGKENYSDDYQSVARKYIEDLFKKGRIYDIERETSPD